jgi:DnaJ domain
MKTETPNETLGLSQDATAADVRQAYANLAKQFHPDACYGLDPGDQQQARLVYHAINEASSILLRQADRVAPKPVALPMPTSQYLVPQTVKAALARNQDGSCEELIANATMLLGSGDFWGVISMLMNTASFMPAQYRYDAQALLATAASSDGFSTTRSATEPRM